MSQRARFLPLAATAILLLGSALRPAAAYVDRADSSAGIQRQPLAAAAIGLELRGAGPHLPAATSRRLRLAHVIIVRTSPEKGAVAPQTLGKVEVWYDAGIRSAFVALAVINAAGDRVDKHDAAIDTFDPSHVSASVEALAPGEYTVRYRAISADGHQISGSWIFEVHDQ